MRTSYIGLCYFCGRLTRIDLVPGPTWGSELLATNTCPCPHEAHPFHVSRSYAEFACMTSSERKASNYRP